MTAYSHAELVTMTRADLLAIYNEYSDRPLASFKDHPTAVARTAAVLGLEDSQEEAEESFEQAPATHAEPNTENEPAAILGASSEDDDGPMCSNLCDTGSVSATKDRYDPADPVNADRAAKYGFISPRAYCDAVRAKHTYRKAVTAGADNVAELKARWQAAEKGGKNGRKVRVAS